MFSVVQSGESVILQSPSSNLEIWPDCGAILNSWQVKMHDRAWSIIEGYESQQDFKKNCEGKGFRSCKLSPYVCRINKRQYQFNTGQYSIGKYELAGNALHGLMYDSAFEILNSKASDYYATMTLGATYNATDAGYPFSYAMQVVYMLHPDNQLDVTTTITNTSPAAIPIADGWHPYFSLGRKVNELKLIINTDTVVESDDALIPTGELKDYHLFQVPELINERSFDTCFVLRNPLHAAACRLINEADKIQLVVDTGKTYSYLQFYTPAHRNSIAIECLSAAPDAFNNQMGLTILEPGKTVSFGVSYKLEALPDIN